jgi:hypothetical protein
MQQISSLFIGLQGAQRTLLKLFDAPETVRNDGKTGYSPMFLSPLPRFFVVPVKRSQVATQHEHLFNG